MTMIVLMVVLVLADVTITVWMRKGMTEPTEDLEDEDLEEDPDEEDDEVPEPAPGRASVRCEPEQIRPPTKRKGECGITGCRIMKPHSHVDDLTKLLKEKKR